MKKYGIWKFTLLNVSGEVVIGKITARSGKDARSRVEAFYDGCEILKMTRVEWLNGFSYSQLSTALLNFDPNYGQALLDILADNGVFSSGENKSETVD